MRDNNLCKFFMITKVISKVRQKIYGLSLIFVFCNISSASAFMSGWEVAKLGEYQDYVASYDAPILVDIARDGINRIEVENDRIEQVVGDMRFFNVMHDEQSGLLFLTVKRTNSNHDTIELSLRLSSGRHIDLKCKVKQGARRLVKIVDLALSKKSKGDESKETKEMLQHMILGREGKYFVGYKSVKLKPLILGAEVRQVATYRYDNLLGYRLKVRNKTKKTLKLTSSDFSNNFAEVLAVYPHEQLLAKKAEADFIIITNYKRK